jgi:tetratricopeptide (TPR) repeat protein
MGDYSQAVSIMESMDQKLRTMISLSSIYQNAGDERTALVLLTEARRIESSNKYSDSRDVRTLAEAYLKLDRADEALELLPLISDHYNLRNAATGIAEWFQARKRTSDARLALDIATKRAAQIVSEKSQDIPRTASTSRALQKSHDLMALVESYLKIDDAVSAEHAARAIDHPQYRASALALTASSFAKQGDSAKAEQLLTAALQLSEEAAEYSHDTSREYALYRIAQAAGQAGMNDLASKALEGFLQVLVKSEFYDCEPSTLFEMGLETEACGIPVSKVSRSLLKQIISKAQDDQ